MFDPNKVKETGTFWKINIDTIYHDGWEDGNIFFFPMSIKEHKVKSMKYNRYKDCYDIEDIDGNLFDIYETDKFIASTKDEAEELLRDRQKVCWIDNKLDNLLNTLIKIKEKIK